MSLGDFWVVTPSGEAPKSSTYAVKSGSAASIKAGEVVIVDSNAGYVKVAINGSSNTSVYIGIAATSSTDTATVDGVVDVFDDPLCVFRGYATTSANLARAIVHTQVTLDITSSVQTIDENDTTNGTFRIMGFDTNEGTADFRFALTDHINAG